MRSRGSKSIRPGCDAEIVARVASLTNTNAWAKAGVMIRENLDANARHAMVAVTPGNGVAFQRRATTGGISAHTAGARVAAPYWVKLTRAGNTFTAHQSANGSTWTQVGSAVTIAMGATAQVGLAATSHDAAVTTTAVFTHVEVQ
jgi:regulation of enolase protein 1 (concanavalin A-like superfamily)